MKTDCIEDVKMQNNVIGSMGTKSYHMQLEKSSDFPFTFVNDNSVNP